MTHMISKLLRADLYAFGMWLVPFVISIFFYNQDGDLIVDFWIFKVAMVIVGFISFYFLAQLYLKGEQVFNWITFSVIAVVVNSILDLIVLVGFLQMPPIDWLIQIFPVYLILMPLSVWIVFRMAKKD